MKTALKLKPRPAKVNRLGAMLYTNGKWLMDKELVGR